MYKIKVIQFIDYARNKILSKVYRCTKSSLFYSLMAQGIK